MGQRHFWKHTHGKTWNEMCVCVRAWVCAYGCVCMHACLWGCVRVCGAFPCFQLMRLIRYWTFAVIAGAPMTRATLVGGRGGRRILSPSLSNWLHARREWGLFNAKMAWSPNTMGCIFVQLIRPCAFKQCGTQQTNNFGVFCSDWCNLSITWLAVVWVNNQTVVRVALHLCFTVAGQRQFARTCVCVLVCVCVCVHLCVCVCVCVYTTSTVRCAFHQQCRDENDTIRNQSKCTQRGKPLRS